MLILLIKKYWEEIAGITVILLMLAILSYDKYELGNKDKEIENLRSKLLLVSSQIEIQNQSILANGIDENKTQTVYRYIDKIHTMYKDKLITIEKFKDSNETNNSCESSIMFLNNFSY